MERPMLKLRPVLLLLFGVHSLREGPGSVFVLSIKDAPVFLSWNKEVLQLKGFSGIDVFFMSEKKWNSLDFPAYQVHAQA